MSAVVKAVVASLWIVTAALWLVVWRLRAWMQRFEARMDSIGEQVEQLRRVHPEVRKPTEIADLGHRSAPRH
jgi:hypothetical protein